MKDVFSLSLLQIANLLGRGIISSLQLTELMLDRISAHDKYINSFVHIFKENALERARILDLERSEGKSRGLLHGIPLGLKDAFNTTEGPTRVGSRLFVDNTSVKDAEVVRRLINAGSIILGKNETTEFCFGGPSIDSAFPPARNPWDRSRWTGGSSGGAAAAVAAQLCFGAFGTDTGGSVRLPAAWCGTVGFVPTQENVSRDGVFELSKSLDCVGVIGKTVTDSVILSNAVSKHVNRLPSSKNLYGTKIALATNALNFAEESVRNVTFEAAHKIRELGCTVSEISGPDIQSHAATQAVITLWEAYSRYNKYLKNQIKKLGFFTRSRLTLGAFIDENDYTIGLNLREQLVQEYAAMMDNFDVLMLPSALTLAPELKINNPFLFLNKPLPTTVANVVRVPALSLPWNIVNGLPTAIQLLGKHCGEEILLSFAYSVEKLRGEWAYPQQYS